MKEQRLFLLHHFPFMQNSQPLTCLPPTPSNRRPTLLRQKLYLFTCACIIRPGLFCGAMMTTSIDEFVKYHFLLGKIQRLS